MENNIHNILGKILFNAGILSRKEEKSFDSLVVYEKILADGSLRNFYRVRLKDSPICIAVSPSATMEKGLEEARSAALIGNHLFNQGVVVPEIFGADDESGLVVFEDCGDVRLYDSVMEKKESLYKEAISQLVYMQVRGAENFREEWCYDSGMYDQQVMIEKESEYFINSFWYDLLDGEFYNGIKEEFEEIAAQAGKGTNNLFLHRDFQSRNVMIVRQGVRFIDFQAGRLGPPGYDLASLLIDPYANLSEELQYNLLQLYISKLATFVEFDTKDFLHQYLYLRLQRNLQILGAFAFLYKRRGKLFFKEFLMPSLQMLNTILSEPAMQPYTRLRDIAAKANKKIKRVLC